MGSRLSRPSRSGLALSVFVLLVGCESRVSLGAACGVASDCPVPYVCAAGRCRAECREARDCPFPLECMLVGNVGGCRVPEDGACPRGTPDCAPGLECIGGRCAQPCADHDECAAAQTCAESGECGRVEEEGPCALLGGSCGEGQRCSSAGCALLTLETAPGNGELFDACGQESDCRDGLTCVAGRCLRWCELGPGRVPQSSCGPGSGCTDHTWTGGEPAPEGRGYCSQPCDPSAIGEAAGCPRGMHCGLLFFRDNKVTTACSPAGASAACGDDAALAGCRHRPCVGGYACNVGLDCSPELTGQGAPDRRCLARCLDDDDCSLPGERCMRDSIAPVTNQDLEPIEVGTCLPTCTIDPGAVTTTVACPSTVAAEGSVSCDVHNGASAGSTWAYCTPSCASDADCFAGLECDEAHAICTPLGRYR